jgi:hypothetical protein
MSFKEMNLIEIIHSANCNKLDKLDKLNKLKAMNKLNKLNKFNELSKLNKLNESNKLNKLNNLNEMNNLNESNKLNKLNNSNESNKLNKNYYRYRALMAAFILLSMSAFIFSGCFSADEGPAIIKNPAASIIISGNFALSTAAAPAIPSLNSPPPDLSINASPSYALINPTSEIILKDVEKNSILMTAPVNAATGRFQFSGPYRGRVVALEVKGSATRIMIGRVPLYLADNAVLNVSRANFAIDEYYAMATNIAESKGMAEYFTVSAAGPETLFDMADKLKASCANYMKLNPAIDLKKILAESSNPDSAVTAGVIAGAASSVFSGYRVSALTPQKVGNAVSITVTACDSFGRTVTGYSGAGTLAISGATGNTAWFGAGVTNGTGGRASFSAAAFTMGAAVFNISNTAADIERTVTITEAATGLSKTLKVSWRDNIVDHFDVTVPGGAQTAGAPFKVIIYAKDKFGSVVGDFTSEVVLSDPARSVSPAVTGKFAAGVWQGNVTISRAAAASYITVDYAGISGKSLSFEVLAAAPARLAFISRPAALQSAGAPFGLIQIGVYDTYENLIQTDNATRLIAAPGAFGGAGLKGTLSKNAAAGVITFNDISHETSENMTVKFSDAAGVLAAIETGQLFIAPAAAVKLVIARQPVSPVSAGGIFTQQPRINICDAYGNIVTGSSALVTAERGGSGTGALAGTLTIGAIGGAAGFIDLKYSKAENFTIKFSAAGLMPAETTLIKSQASDFDNFEIIPGYAGVLSSGEIVLTVKARDANNNYIYNYAKSGTMNIAGASGNIVWSGAGVTNLSNGYGAYGAAAFTSGAAFIKISNTAADENKIVTITDTETGRGGAVSISWQAGALNHFDVEAAGVQTAGREFAITVTAKDKLNRTITGYTGTVLLTDGTATLTPSALSQFSAGVCAAAVRITKSSSGTVIQAVSGMARGSSAPIVVSPAAAAGIAITTQPSSGVAGAPLTPPLSVTVYDAYSNAVTGDNSTVISAEVIQSPAGLKGSVVKSVSGGRAVFDDLSYLTAENIIIKLTAAGLASVEAAPVAISPGAAYKLEIIQKPDPAQQLTAGAIFPVNFKIAICDSYDNILTADNATKITMERGAYGTGAAAGITSRTAAGGVVEFTDISYQKAEFVSFNFKTSGGAPPVESDPYKVSPGAAYVLNISQMPSSSAAGVPFATAPVVELCDKYLNVLTGENSATVTAAALNSDGTPANETLSGTLTKTLVNGKAEFSGLSYKKAGVLYIKFSSAGLHIISGAMTISAGSAAKLAFMDGGPGSQQKKDAPFNPDIRVAVTDLYGNIVLNDSATKVKASRLAGAGVLSGDIEIAALNGICTFSNLKYDRAEEMRLRFTSGSFAGLDSGAIYVNP